MISVDWLRLRDALLRYTKLTKVWRCRLVNMLFTYRERVLRQLRRIWDLRDSGGVWRLVELKLKNLLDLLLLNLLVYKEMVPKSLLSRLIRGYMR